MIKVTWKLDKRMINSNNITVTFIFKIDRNLAMPNEIDLMCRMILQHLNILIALKKS